MNAFALLLLLLLAGCASITGPCSIDAAERVVVCEAGGSLTVIPAPTWLPRLAPPADVQPSPRPGSI